MNELFALAIEKTMSSFPELFMPALVYSVLATLVAIYILNWGKVWFHRVGDTLVLMLPGGGTLASPPLVEVFLTGVVLVKNAVLNEATSLLLLELQFFTSLRITMALIIHLLVLGGSSYARNHGLKFSVECMDGRCVHGAGNGNFFHYWACGGYTLLTALGFAPALLFPVFFGLPDGTLGVALLVMASIPWPFLIAKLNASKFSEGWQKIVKGAVDTLMFTTESPGWMLGSITLSVFAFRPMWPRVTKTSLH